MTLTDPTTEATETEDSDVVAESAAESAEELVTEDLLVEEISIDGMCGVY